MNRIPYTIMNTGDGTSTLFAEEYGEAMHSNSGAYQEALLKHVVPSRILEKEKDELRVLDVGFGLGYNVLALLTEFLPRSPRRALSIISLEKDFSHYPLMKEISWGDGRDALYAEILTAFESGEFSSDRLRLTVRRGDARNLVRSLGGMAFDAVFHDPYSPSKNPELWTLEFFREIYRLTAEDGVLTTYSCAPQARMALLEAGFRLGRGPSVGRKREGTIAARGGEIPFLGEDDIRELRDNARSAPYRDLGMNHSRGDILEARRAAVRAARGVS